MRRIYLIGFLLFLSATAFAQTEKGQFIVSGRTSLDFTYSSTKVEGNQIPEGSDSSQDSYNFNISPALGYFVIDNLAVTLQASYGINNGKTHNEIAQFAIMPGIVYYLPTEKNVRPFAQVGGGYVNISSKTPLSSGGFATQSFGGYTLAGGIGLAFFVKDNISIELSGQYARINTSYSADSSVKMDMNSFSGSIGFSLFF